MPSVPPSVPDLGWYLIAGLDAALVGAAVAIALLLRPWRMLAGLRAASRSSPLLTPLFATLALLPWLWAMPRLQSLPLAIQLSGACLVGLMLGWPLAVLVLTGVALAAAAIAPAEAGAIAHQLVWAGLVPLSIALGIGVGLRRWVGTDPFLYILGRGCAGTVVAVFAAGLLAPDLLGEDATLLPVNVARWLMAWGDAVVTGTTAAILVTYRPEWLATWSDRTSTPPRR